MGSSDAEVVESAGVAEGDHALGVEPVGGDPVVGSRATAEDLPDASYAGQHNSFLDIENEERLLDAWQRCLASLFTERGVHYRVHHGFDQFREALSIGVMRMVRSDIATSSIAFTLDTETGIRDVVFITASHGLADTSAERERFCLDDAEVLELAGIAMAIERHYGRPMDVEWAKGGPDGWLYVVQARPETARSRSLRGIVVEKAAPPGSSWIR